MWRTGVQLGVTQYLWEAEGGDLLIIYIIQDNEGRTIGDIGVKVTSKTQNLEQLLITHVDHIPMSKDPSESPDYLVSHPATVRSNPILLRGREGDLLIRYIIQDYEGDTIGDIGVELISNTKGCNHQDSPSQIDTIQERALDVTLFFCLGKRTLSGQLLGNIGFTEFYDICHWLTEWHRLL